jgi:hypothetical protein
LSQGSAAHYGKALQWRDLQEYLENVSESKGLRTVSAVPHGGSHRASVRGLVFGGKESQLLISSQGDRFAHWKTESGNEFHFLFPTFCNSTSAIFDHESQLTLALVVLSTDALSNDAEGL